MMEEKCGEGRYFHHYYDYLQLNKIVKFLSSSTALFVDYWYVQLFTCKSFTCSGNHYHHWKKLALLEKFATTGKIFLYWKFLTARARANKGWKSFPIEPAFSSSTSFFQSILEIFPVCTSYFQPIQLFPKLPGIPW